MAQFQAYNPRVEVIGKTVNMVIDVMGLFERMVREIFARHGIVNVTDEGWYPQQAYLNVYREIYEKVGAKTMKRIGREVPEKALWPPHIKDILSALQSIDAAYHLNHRGGEIGHYRFEQTGERAGVIVCDNPYPCPFDFGLIEATAMKFAPRDGRVQVKHDDSQPCRVKGGDTCTYRIVW